MAWIAAAVGGLISAVAGAQNKPKSNTTTGTSAPWASQSPYLEQLFREAAGAYGGGSLSQVAGFTPDERLGRTQTAQIASQLPGMVPTQQWQNSLNAPDLTNNPYIQKYIQAALNPIMQQLQSNILPSIRSDAVSSGMYGGSRQGVGEGIAVRDWTQTSGDITSRILGDAYNRGMTQQMQALALTPQMLGAQTYGADILRGLGLEERTMNQAMLDSVYQGLNRYQGLVGGAQYGSASSTTSPNFTQYPNTFQNFVGGASSGAGLWGSLKDLFPPQQQTTPSQQPGGYTDSWLY